MKQANIQNKVQAGRWHYFAIELPLGLLGLWIALPLAFLAAMRRDILAAGWERKLGNAVVWALLTATIHGDAGAAGKFPAPSSAPPSRLLGTAWDFQDGSLAPWQHKDNATISLAEDGGNRSLRLESGFEPFTYTWATRHFPRHTADGAVHLAFRARGDASGHRLHWILGAPLPGGPDWLYYSDEDQAIPLDFTGWREFRVDLARFRTPAGGLRKRDLDNIVFLECFVTARRPGVPLDLQLDDVRFTGATTEDAACAEELRRAGIAARNEANALLGQARKRLTGLRRQLESRAGQGKYVAVAWVYQAAADWCLRDAARLLEAGEVPLVLQGRVLAAALVQWLEKPEDILSRVRDRPPEDGDPLRFQDNPYFQSVVAGVRPWAGKEEWWPKGQKGYAAIQDAWTFRDLGDRLFGIAFALTRPRSPLRHDPLLAANALNLVDTIAHQHTDGDFNIDRTAGHSSYDGNINRFCLAHALDAWWELTRAYPDLLPPAKRADIEAGLKRLADFQVADYGLARLARQPQEAHPAFPNMDAHHVLIMELARRFWGEQPYAGEIGAFVKLLDAAVYPMGAWAYINTQNECFTYHQINVLYSARFWQLTGNPVTLAMLRRTVPYYPYNVEPTGMPEYFTDPCFKHYWNGAGADATAPGTIAALFDDPLNGRVAETAAAVFGYGQGHYAAIAAEFWKPLASRRLPNNHVIFDTNIDGPRGRYGAWSFAGNGRDYGTGYQGKDTFVGCMIGNARRRPLPLDSALQVVTAEVRLNHTDDHWRGGLCHSAAERLTTTLGEDFGSLAVRYTVSKPNWHHRCDDLFPWEGTQAWFLSRDRLVGLVALEATADEVRAAVHGRIRLGPERGLEPAGGTAWDYGRMRVELHGHNYARVVARPSETFYDDRPENYRSTEITLLDPLSVAAGQQGAVKYPRGTRYWFLVEVRPGGSPPAEEVRRIEQGRVVGFSFREPGRNVCILFNPTDTPAEASLPEAGFPPSATRIYRDRSGKPTGAAEPATVLRLEPYTHAVVVAESLPGG